MGINGDVTLGLWRGGGKYVTVCGKINWGWYFYHRGKCVIGASKGFQLQVDQLISCKCCHMPQELGITCARLSSFPSDLLSLKQALARPITLP